MSDNYADADFREVRMPLAGISLTAPILAPPEVALQPLKPTTTTTTTTSTTPSTLSMPVAPLLGTSKPDSVTIPRARGEPLPMPCIPSRASVMDAPSAHGLLTLDQVPMRPLLLPESSAVVHVREELQDACMQMEDVLASFGVQALSVLDSHMTFHGGVDGAADVFLIEVYEDLVQFDDQGNAFSHHVFVFEALDSSRQSAIDALAQRVSASLN